jgi:hypothetical protein
MPGNEPKTMLRRVIKTALFALNVRRGRYAELSEQPRRFRASKNPERRSVNPFTPHCNASKR